MVYGIRLITNATIIIVIVPVNTNGFLLNAMTSAIPTTEPGMIYGTIDTVSIILLRILFLLTMEVFAQLQKEELLLLIYVA